MLVVIPIVMIREKLNNTMPGKTIPVTLVVRAEQKLYTLDLEEYLVGVVAAEMPAKFELEALKAQAVAARTIAIGRMRCYGGRGTRYCETADFSDDPGESQAWLGLNQLKVKWGRWGFGRYYRKVRQAVKETSGIILVYQGKPIDAVFHSTCGIGTEAASDVWNNHIPYLQRVECGVDQESPRYCQRVFYSWGEASRLLGLPVNLIRKLKITKWTAGGRVSRLTCGDRVIDGKDFRQRLALNSNVYQIEKTGAGIRITVTGYGHGVGMCQYGANGLARRGWDYSRILAHYYRGVSFSRIRY